MDEMNGMPMHVSHWFLIAAGLTTLAIAGSILASLRPGAGPAPRAAHLTMAATMLAQIGWMNRTTQLLSLVVVALAAGAVGLHVSRAGTGHGCLTDLLGMAAVLATPILTGGDLGAVVAVAAIWAITSPALRVVRPEGDDRWEGLGAVVAAGAMAAMAVAMNSG